MAPSPSSSPSPSASSDSPTSLLDALADALPAGYRFGIYHLSTPPTRHAALFHAPPGGRPDRTYCESHFLAVTIDVPAEEDGRAPDRLLAFALEVLVFSTAFCTTVFVSKADSSGALPLLRLPRGAPSPVRAVAAAFVAHLVAHRGRRRGRRGHRRHGPVVQTVVSLFARAQAQYLFPRSVENPGKHVLDDRGLVRWWCRVLDPLVGGGGGSTSGSSTAGGSTTPWAAVRGYLMVPGLEPQETRALLPRPPSPAPAGWTLGHPLEHISHYVRERGGDAGAAARVPPRCLVAQFPDDPKSRFRDELDDEAEARSVVPGKMESSSSAGSGGGGSGGSTATGLWKSVRTLDQFWDMMAFRQECSSGRMTGFLWVVFDPAAEDDGPADVPADEDDGCRRSPPPKKKKTKKKPLRGRIVPRVPRIKTAAAATNDDAGPGGPPATTAHYAWPRAGRGARVVAAPDYKRAVELLLLLDFAARDKAVRSTRRWIAEVGGGDDWRREVTGRCAFVAGGGPDTTTTTTTTAVGTRAAPVNLTGLVKRKRAPSGTTAPAPAPETTPAAARVLDSGLVRKKLKPAAG